MELHDQTEKTQKVKDLKLFKLFCGGSDTKQMPLRLSALELQEQLIRRLGGREHAAVFTFVDLEATEQEIALNRVANRTGYAGRYRAGGSP